MFKRNIFCTCIVVIVFSFHNCTQDKKPATSTVVESDSLIQQKYMLQIDSLNKLLIQQQNELTDLQQEIQKKERSTDKYITGQSVAKKEGQLSKELEIFKDSIKKIRITKQKFKQELDQSQLELDSLTQFIAQLGNEKKLLEKELQTLQKSQNTLELKHKELTVNNLALSKQLEEKEQSVSHLLLQTEELEQKNKTLEDKLNKVSKSKQELDEQLQMLQKSVENNHDLISANTNSNALLKNELQTTKTRNEELNKALLTAGHKVDSLNNMLQAKQAELETFKVKLKNIDKKDSEKNDSEKKQLWAQSVDSLQTIIDELQKTSKGQSSNAAEIRLELKKSQAHIDKLQIKFDSTLHEKTRLEAQLLKLKDEQNTVKNNLEASKAEITELNKMLLENNQELNNFQLKEKELTTEKEALQKQLNTLAIQKNNIEEQLDETRKALAEKENIISENINQTGQSNQLLKSLQNENIEKTQKLSSANLKIDSLLIIEENRKRELKKVKEANLVIQKEIAEYNLSKIKYQNKIDSLNTIITVANNTQTETSELKNELENYKQQYEREKRRVEKLMQSLDSSEYIIHQKDENIIALRERATEIDQKVKRIEKEKDSLSKHIEQQNSDIAKTENNITEDTIEIIPETENNIPIENNDFNPDDFYPLNTSRAKIKLINPDFLSSFIEKYSEKYTSRKRGLENFILKEYFSFYVDTMGTVVKITDERTEFNQNTSILKDKDIQELYKTKFKPVYIGKKKKAVKVSIGIIANIQNTSYEYKVQKDKIRVYKTPMYVEYVEPKDKQYSVIKDTTLGYLKVTDKFNISILDGSYAVKEFSEIEYNPFAKEKSTLIENNILKITKLRGIR